MKRGFFDVRMLIATLFVALMAVSCDNNPDESNNVTVFLNQAEIEYDESGMWVNAYTSTEIVAQGVKFSHYGSNSGGYSYWTGFIASRNSDVTDYSEGNWLEHQCTVMTGGGLSGAGTPYLVAYWNTTENLDSATTSETPSCLISYASDNQLFTPISVFVNNTTYSYYAMKNGTAYSNPFLTGDYCKLLAYGIKADGILSGPAEMYLAEFKSDDDSPISDWTYFNLEALGVVKSIFFRMESSDTGSWGMNNPAYFAIDRMSIRLE